MKRFSKYTVWIMAFMFVVGVIVVYKSFNSVGAIKDFFSELMSILSSFVIGFVIAYLLNTPVKKIEKVLEKCKYRFILNNKKRIAVFSVYIMAVVVIVVVLRLIIPVLGRNIADLCQHMPIYIDSLLNYIKDMHLENIIPSFDIDKLVSKIPIDKFFSSLDFSMIGKYAQSVMGITANVINVFIGIIISIYILFEKDAIKGYIYRILKAVISKEAADSVADKYRTVNGNFSKFVSCQLVDAVIVSTLASVILSLLKVRYAIVLGTLLGIFNLIPYFGAIFASVLAVVITFFTGGLLKAVWTAVSLIAVQQVDGNIIGPRIMGNSLKVSPLLIIFAVTFGGGLFGIVGMLISVPIAASLKSFLDEYLERREVKADSESAGEENGRDG